MQIAFQSYSSNGYTYETFFRIFELLSEKLEPLTKIGYDDPPKIVYESSRQAAKIVDDIFSGRIEPDPILGIEVYAKCKRSYQITFSKSPASDPNGITYTYLSIYKSSFFTGKYISSQNYIEIINAIFSLTQSLVAFTGSGFFNRSGVPINWYTILGESYFDLLGGRENILNAPAFKTYDLGNAVGIQTTEHPWSNGGDWTHNNEQINIAIAKHLDPVGSVIIRPPFESGIVNPTVPSREYFI